MKGTRGAVTLVLAVGAIVLGGCDVETDTPSNGGGGSGPDATSCHPSYKGACLDPNASDYDCAGGSGNGPEYTGTVRVVGYDEYGLDADGDGYGCE
jgi:hypothetical protein